jgi:chromosome segregation ATPase
MDVFFQFEQQLVQERERSEGLNSTIRECEDRIAQLEEERQLTAENVNRLEDDLLRRDEEISRYSQQLREQELEAENLHEEIEKLEHDYERVVNEHSLTLKEASGSESETRRQLQDLVRQKAGVDEELKSTKERNESLKNEMERLRNHVHDLQQESADKEVRIVQLEKQHGQDKEDIQGLNMALDAKQQEVALVRILSFVVALSSLADSMQCLFSTNARCRSRRPHHPPRLVHR